MITAKKNQNTSMQDIPIFDNEPAIKAIDRMTDKVKELRKYGYTLFYAKNGYPVSCPICKTTMHDVCDTENSHRVCNTCKKSTHWTKELKKANELAKRFT